MSTGSGAIQNTNVTKKGTEKGRPLGRSSDAAEILACPPKKTYGFDILPGGWKGAAMPP